MLAVSPKGPAEELTQRHLPLGSSGEQRRACGWKERRAQLPERAEKLLSQGPDSLFLRVSKVESGVSRLIVKAAETVFPLIWSNQTLGPAPKLWLNY